MGPATPIYGSGMPMPHDRYGDLACTDDGICIQKSIIGVNGGVAGLWTVIL